jgi:large subunit ribosomal protein L10
MMNRQKKSGVIESLKNDFATSKASFIVGLQGLTVREMESLRQKLRKDGGKLQVAKGRLAKIAIRDVSSVQVLIPYCKNQVGFVFAADQPPVIAKVLYDFSKNHELLSLVAGCLDAQLVNSESIVRIANLPSREVVLAQLCGVLKAPVVGFASLLHQMPVRLVCVLNALAQKK